MRKQTRLNSMVKHTLLSSLFHQSDEKRRERKNTSWYSDSHSRSGSPLPPGSSRTICRIVRWMHAYRLGAPYCIGHWSGVDIGQQVQRQCGSYMWPWTVLVFWLVSTKQVPKLMSPLPSFCAEGSDSLYSSTVINWVETAIICKAIMLILHKHHRSVSHYFCTWCKTVISWNFQYCRMHFI